MSATATPGRLRRPLAPPPRRSKAAIWIGVAGVVFLIVLAPVALFAGAGNPPCSASLAGGSSQVGGINDTGGTPAAGHFAAPLKLQSGRWYRVGATEYGPPGTGTQGSAPGEEGNLAAHPDSFAELSTLDSNPANVPGGALTFGQADALSSLPYLTNLRVRGPSGKQLVLAKRDIGYGQGPGGQGPGSLIYRIDVYNGAAPQLGVSKSPVSVELAPTSGTSPILGDNPTAPTPTDPACGSAGSADLGALQLTRAQTAQINPHTGAASAPVAAPQPVKLAIAAANEIHTKPYSIQYPDGSGAASHAYGPLSRLWPAYDCSGSTSFVLYKAGLFGPDAWVSGQFESWGAAGPGKWISVYANSGHVFLVVAGRAFDTADYGGPNIPDRPYPFGPRWRSDPTGNLADGDAYAVRHPTAAWNDPS